MRMRQSELGRGHPPRGADAPPPPENGGRRGRSARTGLAW
jgi:hypothetical protein